MDMENQNISDKKVDPKIWKKLIKYALKYKKTIVTLMVALVFMSIIDIIYPLLTKYAIDNFVVKNTTDGILTFGIIYAIIVIVQAFTVRTFISLSGKIEMYVSYDIRQDGFKKLQELSFSYYDRTSVGFIMSRMVGDTAMLSEMVAWSMTDILWSFLFLVGTIISMLLLNWKLALLVMMVIPPLAVISLKFRKKILQQQRIVREANSKITGAYNEGIMGAVTTKTLVHEDKSFDDFKILSTEMKKASIHSAVLSSIFLPIVVMLGSLATGIALYVGGNATINEVIGFGTLSAFISYTTQFFEPVQQIASILAQFQSAQASAERLITLLDTPLEIKDSDEVVEKYGDNFNPKTENFPPIYGDIEFKDVSFSYTNGEKVLENFNLKVKAGQTIALVGETGAGKSTIVNLVCRFYEPTSGQVLIDGVDYRKRSQLWLESSLGYVLQQPHLFSGTIRDNIAYGNKNATDEQIKNAAKLVHAEEFILKQESGYDTQVGEGGVRLSTGEKQLISFARVILADPKIFVLDEATSSIDTETELLIQNAINEILKNRTSFIIAHRLSTIRNADRILVIKGGKIVESGNHNELIKQKGYYYKLYTTQFREESSKELLKKQEK